MKRKHEAESGQASRRPQRSRALGKLSALLAVLVVFVVGYVFFGDYLSLDYLARQEGTLHQFGEAHPVLVFIIALAIYVAVTGLSLPGAAGLTLVCGWLFGFWRGVIRVSFASTAGATLAFLFSRYLLRDTIQQRFGDRLAAFNKALEREGRFICSLCGSFPPCPFS